MKWSRTKKKSKSLRDFEFFFARIPFRNIVENDVDLMKMTSKNVEMHPKCDDLIKITSKNVEMCSKCVDQMKITSKNVEMCSTCVDFMKMTSENVEFALAPARRNARSD